MAINGAEDLSSSDLLRELEQGAGRVVIFQFCVSFVFVTVKNSTGMFYISAGGGTFTKSLPYMLLTLLLGWWGVPWGPVYSIQVLVGNLSGGIDVTNSVIAHLRAGMDHNVLHTLHLNYPTVTKTQLPVIDGAVRVLWSDGREYIGQLYKLEGDHALVGFEGKEPVWVPRHALR